MPQSKNPFQITKNIQSSTAEFCAKMEVIAKGLEKLAKHARKLTSKWGFPGISDLFSIGSSLFEKSSKVHSKISAYIPSNILLRLDKLLKLEETSSKSIQNECSRILSENIGMKNLISKQQANFHKISSNMEETKEKIHKKKTAEQSAKFENKFFALKKQEEEVKFTLKQTQIKSTQNFFQAYQSIKPFMQSQWY
jgi:hypothetical protein